MVNPYRGESQIGDDGIVLVYDFNALCEIRAQLGGDLRCDMPLDEIFERIASGDLSVIDLRAVLTALLRNRWPGVTPRLAGEVMTNHPDEVMSAIRLAMNRAMPDREEGDPLGKPMRR